MENNLPLPTSVNPLFDVTIPFVGRCCSRELKYNSGVYAFCFNKPPSFCDYLYVGASVQLCTRLKAGWKDNIYLKTLIDNLDKNRFTIKIKFVSVETPKELGIIEREYIEKLKPRLNCRDAGLRAYHKGSGVWASSGVSVLNGKIAG